MLRDADSRWRKSHNEGNSHRTTETMSEEQLKAFLEAVKADEGLQEQLKAAADADAVVAIAKSVGFVISLDELEAAVQAAVDELSDEEIESVTGGRLFQNRRVRVLTGLLIGDAVAVLVISSIVK